MKTVIGIDPGLTTGIAIHRGRNDYECFQVQATGIWETLTMTNPDFIVAESFQLRRAPKVDLTPVEVIGVIKAWAGLYGIPVKWYPASYGKHFWTNDRLKKLGVYIPGKPHAMDALRHLLTYRMAQGEIDPI